MIGNDVVDLKLARLQSNWRRNGFLEKVFVAKEQNMIWASNDLEHTVWMLWSMKEAAYKANQRLKKLPRKLNWTSFQCELSERRGQKVEGAVRINDKVYFTESEITADYVFTSASSTKNEVFENLCLTTPMKTIKEKLLAQVSGLYGIPKAHLSLQKDEQGVPYIKNLQAEIFSNFSLTDHGKYAAFSLSLTNC